METILIVDDHQLIFDGLKNSDLADSFLLLYAATALNALAIVATTPLAACVLDLSLGKVSGLEILKTLAEKAPTFILTMHNSGSLIRQTQALGARGYFLKDEGLDLLLTALRNPAGRDFWLSDNLAITTDPHAKPAGFDVLTQREQQVFILMAEGLGYKEIAERLGVSPKTVNIFKDNVMKKLHLDSLADVVKLAIQLGLIVV